MIISFTFCYFSFIFDDKRSSMFVINPEELEEYRDFQ